MKKKNHNKSKKDRFNLSKATIKLADNDREEIFTTNEVAKIFNVSVTTVINWCKTGRLACHRLPGTGSYKHRRIKKTDINRMIAEDVEYFEPKKVVHTPGSVIPMIDNQIRVWNQQSIAARNDGKDGLADKIDCWIEGASVCRRIVSRSITEKELEPYREEGVDYYL